MTMAEDQLRAGFGARLADAVRRRGPLCVGIDPHPSLLHAWDLGESPQALERFALTVVEALADLGFEILATEGTAEVLRRNGITSTVVAKHTESVEGDRDVVDLIKAGEVDMIINTPYGNPGPRVDGYEIRTAAVSRDVPCITTVQGAAAAVQGIEAAIQGNIGVRPLQALQAALRQGR